VDIRTLMMCIKNAETETLVSIVQKIQGYLVFLEVVESLLMCEYIEAVRKVLKQSISVHKSLVLNEIADTEPLKRAVMHYNTQICLLKNEYDPRKSSRISLYLINSGKNRFWP